MASIATTISKPDIIVLSDLLDGVMQGEYRIPKFQRPYVWSLDDMVQLFDSVSKGYPIGSLLIWQTERGDISSLSQIGPIELDEAGPLLKSYVVDGHQRLATLLGVLKLSESYPRERPDEWRWWIGYDLQNERFEHIRDANIEIPLTMMPLRNLLRTVDFARRSRDLLSSKALEPEEANLLLDRADALQRAIREYRVPIIVMRSSSLDDAVTIFARVNQRGKEMTPDQMVSALTYRDKSEGDFDLSVSIDNILGMLRECGFADLKRSIVLQVILALAGLDFTRPSYEKVADRKSFVVLRSAAYRAGEALLHSVKFLSDVVGVRTSKLLPYSSIAVMLALYFDRRGAMPEIESPELGTLRKWFWGTSFNGWFAGANTTDLRQAGSLMRSFGDSYEKSREQLERYFLSRPIREFPESFDRRSARVRASLLVQILAGVPLHPHTAAPIDGMAVFEDESARDIPYFFPNQRRPRVSNPANRVILPDGFPRNVRSVFCNIPQDSNRSRILASHMITEDAFEALCGDDFETFIQLREERIFDLEKSYLAGIGIEVGKMADRSAEEYDSDV